MQKTLLVTLIGIGIISGALINVSLGYKIYEPGGLLGGAITGLLMYVL
jgi:hypothetical protein